MSGRPAQTPETPRERTFDLHRLTPSDRACAASGVLLLVTMSMPWYTFEASMPVPGSPWAASERSFSIGWEIGASALVFLACVAAVAGAVLAAFGHRVTLPISTGLVVSLLGALSFVIVTAEALDPFEHWDVAAGLIASPFAAASIVAAGLLAMHHEGTSVGGEWRRLQRRFGARRTA